MSKNIKLYAILVATCVLTGCQSGGNGPQQDSKLGQYDLAMTNAAERCAGNAYDKTFGGSSTLSASAKMDLTSIMKGQGEFTGEVKNDTKRKLAEIIGEPTVDKFLAQFNPCMDSERQTIVDLVNN